MPRISDGVVCRAAPIDLWRLVHDPARLHEWLADTERVEPGDEGTVVRYLHGWPDYPMPTRVTSPARGSAVTISCMVSDIDLIVTLVEHADGCRVEVVVDVPEEEAARCAGLEALLRASLRRLAQRAAGEGALV
jgi:hypothetical protein